MYGYQTNKPFFDIDKLLIDQYIMNGGRIFWLVEGTTKYE